MVKIFNKKKKDIERVLANGKIIITDFKHLSLDNFNYCVKSKEELQGQLALLSPDGKLFVNSTQDGYEILSQIFQICNFDSNS